MVSGLFGYDEGLDCACDESDQGSDLECAHGLGS